MGQVSLKKMCKYLKDQGLKDKDWLSFKYDINGIIFSVTCLPVSISDPFPAIFH